jgi:surfactin synthase thioesterase subunit
MSNVVLFNSTQRVSTVYCFPYAGGGPSVYYPLSKRLDGFLNVAAINFPGKGASIATPPLQSMSELVEFAFSELEADGAFSGSYYLLGYSLGSKIVAMLLEKITSLGLRLPETVFFCASTSPEHAVLRESSKLMTDNEFLELLRSMGGTPRELLDNRDIMNIYLPAIRADFNISDEFINEAPKTPYDVNVVVLYGTQDEYLTEKLMSSWAKYSQTPILIKSVNEGHFFINTRPDLVEEVIRLSIEGRKNVL